MNRLGLAASALLLCLRASAAPPQAARTVHFRWHVADGDLFYNEATVYESVPDTYFAVEGFSQGYFGIQEHEDKDMVIFSVWDSRATDNPDAVAAKNRVEVLYSDPQTVIKRFGGEGTGAQCKYAYNWKAEQTYRFLLKTKLDGKKTAYTAWFYLNETKEWKKLATFRVPTGGAKLKGLYSFVEDFRRDGQSLLQRRRARYGPGWVRTLKGKWAPIIKARFTADDTPLWNVSASSDASGFELATGGDVENYTPLNTILQIPRPIQGPPIDLPDDAAMLSPASGALVFVDSVERCLAQEKKLERFVDLEPKRDECFALAVAMARSDRSIQAKKVYTQAMGEVCAANCAARYAADYKKNYKPLIQTLDSVPLDRDSLSALSDAMTDIAFTTLAPEHTRALVRVYGALETAGQATDAQTLDLYKQLVAMREFDAARALIARRPVKDAPALPAIELSTAIPRLTPKAFDVSGDGMKARLLPMKLAKGPSIIVIVSCHFSDDAISEIEKDPALKDIFEKHSLLITPQHELLRAAEIAAWRDKHPTLKAFVVYKESEWPKIKSWDMPHFYFMNHGRVVFDFGGYWGHDEPKDLWKGLRLIGLAKK